VFFLFREGLAGGLGRQWGRYLGVIGVGVWGGGGSRLVLLSSVRLFT
jgi:hypothetical protein